MGWAEVRKQEWIFCIYQEHLICLVRTEDLYRWKCPARQLLNKNVVNQWIHEIWKADLDQMGKGLDCWTIILVLDMGGLLPVAGRECVLGQVFYTSSSLNNKEKQRQVGIGKWPVSKLRKRKDQLTYPAKALSWSWMISNISQMKGITEWISDVNINKYTYLIQVMLVFGKSGWNYFG